MDRIRGSHLVMRLLGAFALLAAVAGTALPASAQQAPATWVPGPYAAGANTYDGFIDLPPAGSTVSSTTGFVVAGWAFDRTAQGWAGFDMVHVYSGLAGAGGNFLGAGYTGLQRQDAAAAENNVWAGTSGFYVSIPGGTSLGQGSQTLTVYLHTPAKGWWYKQVQVTVTSGSGTSSATSTSTPTVSTGNLAYPQDPTVSISNPSPGQTITTGNDFTLTGDTYDRNKVPGPGTGVDRVQLYLDGERASSSSVYLGDAQIDTNDTRWSLLFHTTNYHEGDHTLYVYAGSKATGRETKTSVTFHISES